MKKMPRISETEWEVMKVIWSKAPCSAGQIIETLQRTDASWHPRTVKAFLSRLVKKKVLGFSREGNQQIQERMNMIAKFHKIYHGLALGAALSAGLAVTGCHRPAPPPVGPPRIVSTSPVVGATEVDPAISEITVTFDRDMEEGMSWTGGGDYLPKSADTSDKAHWRDKRTCVLPVKLAPAHYYRVGINSRNHQNFRSEQGASAEPTAIYFTTQGASEELKKLAQSGEEPDPNAPPRIIATWPAFGATDVDPATTEITVTFDRDMGEGTSWVGGGQTYPHPSESGGTAHWLDKRTCVMPVKLFAAHLYQVGINSPSYHGFRSDQGMPAAPKSLCFTTQGASEQLKRKVNVPQIVSMTPANGASDVNPGTTLLRVTFNVPMGGGFSWCGGGENYPDSPDGKRPYWSADHKTCTMPVQLKPNWQYELSLNATRFKGFSSTDGLPLEPVPYTFKTAEK